MTAFFKQAKSTAWGWIESLYSKVNHSTQDIEAQPQLKSPETTSGDPDKKLNQKKNFPAHLANQSRTNLRATGTNLEPCKSCNAIVKILMRIHFILAIFLYIAWESIVFNVELEAKGSITHLWMLFRAATAYTLLEFVAEFIASKKPTFLAVVRCVFGLLVL